MTRTKVYPLGSSRVEKTLPAIEQEFEVVRADEKPIPEKYRGIGMLRKVGTLFRTLRPIVRHQDELIVIVFSFSTLSLIIASLCNRLGVPFLVRIRGGMCNEFRDRARTKGESKWAARLYGSANDYRRDLVFSRADGVLPVSKYTRHQFFTELSASMPPDKVQVVGNPLEVERFSDVPAGRFKQTLDIPEGDHLAVTITSFNYTGKFRGVSYFMPAIGRVLDTHSDWHIAIVGDGAAIEKGHEEILSAVPEGVQNRIHLPGFWSPIETALADAEIAFHFSYRDTAAMTVLEEQAAQLPVIVNSACGMKNLLDESNTPQGIPAVVSEPEELEHPFEELIKNPSIRNRVGEQNRKHVQAKFSPEEVGEGFKRAIDSILCVQYDGRKRQYSD